MRTIVIDKDMSMLTDLHLVDLLENHFPQKEEFRIMRAPLDLLMFTQFHNKSTLLLQLFINIEGTFSFLFDFCINFEDIFKLRS